MEIKICTKCGKELPATTEYFYNRKDGRFNLHAWCIKCCKEYYKQQYEKKKDYVLKKRKKYLQSEKGKAHQKKYWGSESSKASKRKYKQSEKGKNTNREYLQSENGKEARKRYSESEKYKTYQKEYSGSESGRKARKKFYKKNKLSCNMSTMIGQSLKGNKAGRHWETLVPYTLEDLKQHLENLFQLKMSWNNYGEWHVDHKIPKSIFKFTSHEDKEFQKCWALKNLQPLWAEENQRKYNKLVW